MTIDVLDNDDPGSNGPLTITEINGTPITAGSPVTLTDPVTGLPIGVVSLSDGGNSDPADDVLVFDVRVFVDVVDRLGVEQGRAALDAVDDVALLEQEFGQVGAVLAGDAGNQCGFVAHGAQRMCQQFEWKGAAR